MRSIGTNGVVHVNPPGHAVCPHLSTSCSCLLCPGSGSTLQSSELPQQVDSLLKGVEATNIFEREMARRFEGVVDRELTSSEDAEGGAGGGASGPADDSTPASLVRQRYEKLAREKQRMVEGVSPARRKEQVRWAGGGRDVWGATSGVHVCLGRQASEGGLPCLPACLLCCCIAACVLTHALLVAVSSLGTGACHFSSGGQDKLQGSHLLGVCAIPGVSRAAVCVFMCVYSCVCVCGCVNMCVCRGKT